MKKLFALVLSFCLCLTMCPKVFADENENIIAQKNKEIYFKKDIKCENFSKATHKHPTNK